MRPIVVPLITRIMVHSMGRLLKCSWDHATTTCFRHQLLRVIALLLQFTKVLHWHRPNLENSSLHLLFQKLMYFGILLAARTDDDDTVPSQK